LRNTQPENEEGAGAPSSLIPVVLLAWSAAHFDHYEPRLISIFF